MSRNNHTPAPFQVSIEVGGRPLHSRTGKIASSQLRPLPHAMATPFCSLAPDGHQAERSRLSPADRGLPRKYLLPPANISRWLCSNAKAATEKEMLVSRLMTAPCFSVPRFLAQWRPRSIAMVLSARSYNDPERHRSYQLTPPPAPPPLIAPTDRSPYPHRRCSRRLLVWQLVCQSDVAEQKTSKLNIVVSGNRRWLRPGGIGRVRKFGRKSRGGAGVLAAPGQEIVAGIKQLARTYHAQKSLSLLRFPFDQSHL